MLDVVSWMLYAVCCMLHARLRWKGASQLPLDAAGGFVLCVQSRGLFIRLVVCPTERVHRQHSLCPHGLALPLAPRLAFECVYACVVCSTEPRFCKPTEIGFFVAKTVRQVAGGYASCTC